METLLALGEGYSEVSWADRLYPRVSLAFRTDYGVVGCWSSAEQVHLLLGDGVIGDDETVPVPELEGDAEFTGVFASSRDRAWSVVNQFIESGSIEGLGQWIEL
jgi:hypothetical protein